MTALIGMQKYFNYLKKLAKLEYDAVEAYKIAINKLSNDDYKAQMRLFLTVHRHHIIDLKQILAAYGESVKYSDYRQWSVKILASLKDLLKSDIGILKIISNVEEDISLVYERYIGYKGIEQADTKILQQCLLDEKKHKNWIDITLKSILYYDQNAGPRGC